MRKNLRGLAAAVLPLALLVGCTIDEREDADAGPAAALDAESAVAPDAAQPVPGDAAVGPGLDASQPVPPDAGQPPVGEDAGPQVEVDAGAQVEVDAGAQVDAGFFALESILLNGGNGVSTTIPDAVQNTVEYVPADATDKSLAWTVCTAQPASCSPDTSGKCRTCTPASDLGSVTSAGLYTPPATIPANPTTVYLVACQGSAPTAICDWTEVVVSEGGSTPACSQGEITSDCLCGGTVHSSGYCCSGVHQSGACSVPASSLDGVGWTGSTSLTDYPKTTDTTTCGAGCLIVDVDDGCSAAGQTCDESNGLTSALAALGSYSRVLLRNDSGKPIVLTAQIQRTATWSSNLVDEVTAAGTVGYKQVFAYGSQRIMLDASNVHFPSDTGPLAFEGASHEHWKGFEIVGETWFGGDTTPGGSCATGSFQPAGIVALESASYIKIEDFWIHDNLAGEPVYMNGYDNAHHVIQDTVLYRNGNPGCAANTYSPNGFTADGGPHVFARDLVFNANDDGYDFWRGHHVEVYDCVSWGAGYYPGTTTQAGDGSGFKTGLTGASIEPSMYSGYNSFVGCASIANEHYGIGVGEGDTWPMTYDHITTAQTVSVAGLWPRSIDSLSNTLYTDGMARSAGTSTNNLAVSEAAALFADPANGDFSLCNGGSGVCAGRGVSPAVGQGGTTLGASEIALQLLKDFWGVK